MPGSKAEGERLRKALNPRQLKFCLRYDEIGNGTQSSKDAGFKCKSDNAHAVRAKELLRNPKISAYLDWLKQETETEATLTRQRKREILKEIAEGKSKNVKPGDRIQAVKTDNEMTGDNKPVRIEGEITLNTIMQSLQGSTGLPNEESE